MAILITIGDWIMYITLFVIFILAIFRVKQMHQDIKDVVAEDKQAQMDEAKTLKQNHQHQFDLNYHEHFVVNNYQSITLTDDQIVYVIPDANSLLDKYLQVATYETVTTLIDIYLDSIINLDEYVVNYYVYTDWTTGGTKYFMNRGVTPMKVFSGVVVLTKKTSSIHLYQG